jgi:hypothetical protein
MTMTMTMTTTITPPERRGQYQEELLSLLPE